MVRRWSRINLSNFASHEDYSVFGGVQHLKTFQVTTQFKRFYFGFTKHKRRKAARKNRLSYLIPQLNVIGLWSQEYRFFRHTIKFNYLRCIFLNNYSLHNHVMYANKDTLCKNHFEHFVTASVATRFVNYYASKNTCIFTLNKSMRFSLLHLLSTPNTTLVTDLNPEDKTLSLVSMAAQTSLYPTTLEPIETTSTLNQMVNIQLFTYLAQLLNIYKVMIMLYMSNLFSF